MHKYVSSQKYLILLLLSWYRNEWSLTKNIWILNFNGFSCDIMMISIFYSTETNWKSKKKYFWKFNEVKNNAKLIDYNTLLIDDNYDNNW